VRIFLDANILFSAAAPSSATRRLFNAASHYANLITNPHAWEEAYRNLAHKRPEHISGMKDLEKHIELSYSFSPIGAIELPEHDVPILAGAIGSGCSHIWTSDKRHFGKWYGKKLLGVECISSILLADILINMGWKP
jgi:hypothetical protein